ncbi:Gfo/Idh/MocA family oxidoreductase [Desulfobacterota bacterium AH_259_B03_O07]|nr:Gfo/Idh/MocA family oxidoreductase [Desulfobacterota bacterium AH_259_B03_O07]
MFDYIMIRIGIIGTGFGRVVHIPGFLAIQNATVVGVASRRYKRAQQVAAEFSIPQCFATWKELIKCSEIEAVSVTTPPHLHEEMVLAALDAGKAVLCEKPLALDADQARRMLEATRRAGLVHMVNFEFREIPAWKFVKQLVEAGELGSLGHVNVNWIVDSWADPNRPWSWRADRAQGGGTLGALGIHVLDYIEWLLGPIKSLATHLKTRIDQRPNESDMLRPVNTEDCCHLLLELADGTPINLTISSIAPFGRGHWIEIYGEHKVLIIGSDNLSDYGKGFAVWEGELSSTKLRKRVIPRELQFDREFADGRVAPFLKLAERFIDAIRENKTDVRPSFDDGLRAQILMDLALQAQEERKWLDVPAPNRM